MKKIQLILATIASVIILILAFSGCTVGPNNPNAMFAVSFTPGNPYSIESGAFTTAPSFTLALAGATTSDLYTLTNVSYSVPGTPFSASVNVTNAVVLGGGTTTATYNTEPLPDVSNGVNGLLTYMNANDLTQVNLNYVFTFTDNYNTKYTIKCSPIILVTSDAPTTVFNITGAQYASGSSAATSTLTLTFNQAPTCAAGSTTTWQNVSTSFVFNPNTLSIPSTSSVTFSGMTMTITGINNYQPSYFSVNGPNNPSGANPTQVYSVNSTTGAFSYLQQASAISF